MLKKVTLKQSTNRVNVFGVGIDALSIETAVAQAVGWIEAAERVTHLSSGVNLHQLMLMEGDSRMDRVIKSSDQITADGLPIVWANLFLRRRLISRVASIDVMWKLLDVATERKYRVFLLGATSASLDKAVAAIAEKWPGVRIAGKHHGYFEERDWSLISESIRAAKPDILLIAISSPKREYFYDCAHATLDVPFVIGVGGAFDVLAGNTTRCPRSVQVCGVEWLWRCLQEPRRLTPRYCKNVTFIVKRTLIFFYRRLSNSAAVG